MTAAFEPSPEDGQVDAETMARINASMDLAEAREQRITAYLDRVDTMPGQLGILLRAVGQAHRAFIDAEYANATTIGEYQRLSAVVDEALNTLDWLVDGERADADLPELGDTT